MNASKIRDALKMISEALQSADVTEEQWAEFGRACAEAIRHCYVVDSVAVVEVPSSSWRACALRVWKAAKPLGLHGLRKEYGQPCSH